MLSPSALRVKENNYGRLLLASRALLGDALRDALDPRGESPQHT